MSDNVPSIGIDFGATNSSMAWFDPRTGQAEVILNAEAEAKAPSPMYFSQDETLVGKPVDELIEDVSAGRARGGLPADRHEIKWRLVSPG